MEAIDFLDRGAYLGADRHCFVAGERTWTYEQSRRLTMRIASALTRDGFRIGTHVALLSPNDPVAFMCALGAVRAHMVWVPLNPRNSVEDIVDQLDAFDCEVLFYHSSYESIAAAARARLPAVRRMVCVDAAVGATPVLEQWLDGASDQFSIAPADPHDVMMIMTTGGTTGRPKGVMQTHLAFESMVASRLVSRPTDHPPRFLAAAQLTHGGGLACFPIFARGGTVYVLPAAKPELIMDAIARYRITELTLPVAAVYMLLAHPDVRKHDYSSIEYFNYATAPMSETKLREALDVFGPVMIQGWGQSEALALTFLSKEDHVTANDGSNGKRLLSCGQQLPFAEVAVMDSEGRLLSSGEIGEFVARSNTVMKGYYKDPEATAEAFRFGWHHTGDMGYCDEDGYFYIVDRSKDMIISGGFNVFPSEIERVLWSHPAVQDCAVIGVPDEKWGERITAIVELKAGMSVAAEELLAACKTRLGSVKAPKVVEFWAELPRSPIGKVLKREIREKFWAGAARKV